MKYTKKWVAVANDNNTLRYSFIVDEKPIGTMDSILKSLSKKKAISKIFEKTFYLIHPGSWKGGFVIRDEKDDIILEALLEKWYTDTLILKYKDKDLRLKCRNNSTAECVIFDDELEILRYGLDIQSDNIKIKIGPEDANDYLLDYVLWYLFSGIALETTGGNFVFTY
jgi:hypothetical protein